MNKALSGGYQAPRNPGPTPRRSHSEPMELGSVNQRNKGKKPSGNSNSVSNAEATNNNEQKKNPPKYGQKNKPQNSAKAAPKSGPRPKDSPKTGYCFNCGALDHWANLCPQPKQVNATAPPAEDVLDADNWQGGNDLSTAAIGPLQLNLNL